jgi:hypothetical protein
LPLSRISTALAAIDQAQPLTRKILVASDINWGREALLALARRSGGWIGWEPATLRSIAAELALVPLNRRRTRIAGDVELAALTDRALAQAVETGDVTSRFAALAGGLGFRRAVHDAVQELRTAGVGPRQLRERAARGTPACDLAAVLTRYEALLEGDALADAAAVFRAALEAFDVEAPFVLDGSIALAPDLRMRGLPGRLASRLTERGATVLPPEPADAGIPEAVAELAIFAAATPTDEVREVLRRALARGARWDEVEIVTPDPDTYGLALDAVASHGGISYSFLTGLPLAITRVGRAIERWLAWIGDGLPADALREALESGDIAAPDSDAAPTVLAHLLRSLGIGWGRPRYEAALARLRDAAFARGSGPREDEEPAAFAARAEERGRAAAALANLLDRILAFTPEVAERGSEHAPRTSVAALAHATLGWLDLVPLDGDAEVRTLARLRARVTELASIDDVTSFGAAVAGLRDGLSDLRAWTDAGGGRKPWASRGGAVHLTDVRHGGTTGRPHVFVVGLDADRVAGQRVQDPMLSDEIRLAIDPESLPTTAARREERTRDLAQMFGRLRGTATLSFPAADAAGRSAGPAHQILQAFRAIRSDPALDYEDLRASLGSPCCAVPATENDALDQREAWLAALVDGALLLDGEAQVRAAFPPLDLGLRAAAAADGGELTRYHGLVTAAAGRFDPRQSRRPLSPSSLELLARCPLSWLYRYGLRIRPPDDPVYDPETWLDALQRGALLHAVFERFTRAYAGRRNTIVTENARHDVLARAEDALGEWRARVPPPSEAVYETEAAEIRESVLAFLEAERQALADGDTGDWVAFELRFGWEQVVELPLDGGPLAVHGFIDRVDDLGDGQLRVIDYKTGSPVRYRQNGELGPFNAGRNLQAAVYAAGAEALLGGTAVRFEYRFPAERSDPDPVVYTREQFAAAGGIIGGLLAHVMSGEYVPTTDCDDCRFCDFRPVCRVTTDRWGAVSSARAAWAAEHGGEIPAYARMLARRSAAR